MKRFIVTSFFVFAWQISGFAQCCSGGSGSPIAGGTSQGVLDERQAEINLNFQHAASDKFLTGNKKDKKFLEQFGYDFSYLRLSYGLTKRLTVSLESGYYLERKEVQLGGEEIKSSGISDVVVFPRYTVYSRNCEKTRDEVTVGLGYKMPVGKYNDSLRKTIFTGEEYYLPKPLGVQPTTGSHDLIAYVFAFRGFPEKNFRVFASALYIKKGWNPEGLKYGDYGSISLFVGKTLFRRIGATLQLKGEWIDKMKYNQYFYDMGYYSNYLLDATGMRQISIAPQVSYTFKNLTLYALSEFPVYQYVNQTQVVTERLYTAGLAYRFMTYCEKDDE